MADGEDQYTDAQLQDGTTLRFKGQLTPDIVKQKVSDYKLKTGSGMMTPKAPAPQLPANAGAESPISSAHAQDASIMEATQKAHPVATSPKTIASTAGGIIGGGIAGPAAGLLTRSLATGAGMGLGTSVGQAASGENPIDLESLKESGGRALLGAGTELGMGAIGKATNAVGENGLRGAIGKMVHNPRTGQVTASPGAVLDRMFPSPEPIKTVEPISKSPYYNEHLAARSAIRKSARDAMTPSDTSLAIRPSGGPSGSPDDLISRTRALVKPGEQPSPGDLKRAGDLTQAPIARLKALAKFGDKLAENEINRRLRN